MGEVFEVCIKSYFSAAHCLKGYPGDCAGVHGHNWMVETFVRCTELDGVGIGIDFRDVNAAMREILAGLDHCYLNDLAPFSDRNPTSENIARHIFKELSRKLNTEKIRISRIKVGETPEYGAFYWEE